MSIITISRMYGSGGSEVAALVASALGWQLLDNALVDAVCLSKDELQQQSETFGSNGRMLLASSALT